MSSYQGDDDAAEYMEDVDDEMENVEVDDVGDEFRCGNFDDDDLAASEEFDYSRIPWVMLSISREKYRQTSIIDKLHLYLLFHIGFSILIDRASAFALHASLSPNGKLLAIIGDNPEGLIVDPNSGKTLETLSGHVDYSFASAWHPDGTTLSTGNQDKTCRVWDIRNLSQALAVLKGNIGAIRSIRYTSVGSTWPWLNLLTLSMSTTFQKGMRQSRKYISLGRSLVYLSALTRKRSSLGCGIALMLGSRCVHKELVQWRHRLDYDKVVCLNWTQGTLVLKIL
ncbi:hypothetical protein Bca52824_085771 [Brassica carinata]|uniref:Uncharacterized protein n=1 Tax=Brassica carinata TaxID=52824 RepID=A0A8X7P8S8_BRACI|nr:hypothetical protein Bca52824_085771 [Brassica carinata]